MKKIAIFFIITILIVCAIFAMYISYKANYNMSKKSNLAFEKYLNEEVYGTDLATVINRAIDRNEKNEVTKNNKGIYQNNDENSINIEIKMLDDDSVYKMEKFYNDGIQNFINYYGNIKFKCTDIKYHSATNQVKYMLFEQTTE
ncbi:hypothetical protein EGR52_07725 [bacterium]|nr:hypothetical protein [bacterium]